MVCHNYESSLVVEVKSKKHLDPLLMELNESAIFMFRTSLSQGGDGILSYHERLCVPNVDGLRR